MRIYLIGMMGSGKSTVGKMLAERLAFSFVDLDKVIEKNQEMPVKQIFRVYSEDFFRVCEKNALAQVMSTFDEAVVAAGGGTPCYHNGLSIMKKSGITVYLKCRIEIISERISNDRDARPLADRNAEPVNSLENIFNKRKHFYESADFIVNGEPDPAGVTEEILQKIKLR